jgi:hypothetical protein
VTNRLVRSYPLSTSKDWLDILSAIGQAFGIIALIGLVYEIYRREGELRKKVIPRIEVGTVEMVDTLPADAITCLCETSESGLPETQSHEEDYREMWSLLDDNRKLYFKVQVTNKQEDFEGSAEEVQLWIRFSYTTSIEDALPKTKMIWCPKLPFTLQSGDEKYIYIRIGKITKGGYSYISARFLDCKCKNRRGDRFTGSRIGFYQKPVPQQKIPD